MAEMSGKKKTKSGEGKSSPASCCPNCGADLAAWLNTACPSHMGRKGRGKAKARTSEQAIAAANARWEKHRADKKRPSPLRATNPKPTKKMKTLTGTEKQIEWATKIREEFAQSLETKRTFRLSPESLDLVKNQAKHFLETETDAAWWINGFKSGAHFSNMLGFPLKFGMMIDAAGELQIKNF